MVLELKPQPHPTFACHWLNPPQFWGTTGWVRRKALAEVGLEEAGENPRNIPAHPGGAFLDAPRPVSAPSVFVSLNIRALIETKPAPAQGHVEVPLLPGFQSLVNQEGWKFGRLHGWGKPA